MLGIHGTGYAGHAWHGTCYMLYAMLAYHPCPRSRGPGRCSVSQTCTPQATQPSGWPASLAGIAAAHTTHGERRGHKVGARVPHVPITHHNPPAPHKQLHATQAKHTTGEHTTESTTRQPTGGPAQHCKCLTACTLRMTWPTLAHSE